MKDSIVKWVVAFALLTVIAVAAIFAVEDDEVTSREVEERSQTLENKTLSVDEKHALLDQDGDLNPKRDFKKDKFDQRDGLKKKKPKGKFDRTELGQKAKKGRPGMSRPFPPMMGEGFMPPMMGEGFMPPMMGMMGEGFMPPMMGEGFQTRESEIFQEIEQIFSAILDSLVSIEELSSDTSKATDEEISQSGELTLSLIEELIKETFDERVEEEISELVDRVAKDALTQIIRGLDQESVEQSLEGVTESN
ncbi:MAG: hypothetical protein QGF06_00830 [Acidimicrobiales bacterium]|nr:hypothetical protein [Acidimicrobiales bacterium]